MTHIIQRAFDQQLESDWLEDVTAGPGGFPPTNVFRQGSDFVANEKDHTELTLEDGVPSVSGRIDFSKYENLQPIYTEYNIGYYRRSFSLSPSSIDEHKITADMKDGVLTLTLPKAEWVKPRKIHVK